MILKHYKISSLLPCERSVSPHDLFDWWVEKYGRTLQAFWPGAAAIFADVASPIALAFLRRYPSPRSAKRLTQAQLQRFCNSQHYSGRRSAAELMARLHAAAAGHVGTHTEQAMADVVRAQLAVLVPIVTQIAELTRRIEQFMHSLPDGLLMMSFLGMVPLGSLLFGELARPIRLGPPTRSIRSSHEGWRAARRHRSRIELVPAGRVHGRGRLVAAHRRDL